MNHTRICERCKTVFVTTARSWLTVKYCPPCRKIAYKERKDARRREEKEAPAEFVWVTCELCGDDFKASGSHARFCPRCRKARNQVKNTTAYQRTRAENARPAPEYRSVHASHLLRMHGDSFAATVNLILSGSITYAG